MVKYNAGCELMGETHLNGFYTIVGAIIGAIVGAVLSYYLSQSSIENNIKTNIVDTLSSYHESITNNMTFNEAMKTLTDEVTVLEHENTQLRNNNKKLEEEIIAYKDKITTIETMSNEIKNRDNEIEITAKNIQYFGFDLKAYQWYTYGGDRFYPQDIISMGGKKYTYGLVFETDNYGLGNHKNYASFNLEKQYSLLKGVYGHVDDSADYSRTFEIYGDDKLLKIIEVNSNLFGESFEIDVSNIKQLKIEMQFVHTFNRAKYALAEVELIK